MRKKTKEEYEAEWMGKVFGDILVGEYSHSDKRGVYFWCTCLRCDTKFGPVRLDSLKTGHTKSCGKCATNNPEKYYQEYIGKIYGYTRIDKYSHSDEFWKPYFWCTCLKCGKEFDKPVYLNTLKSGHSKSCGKCATNNPEKYYQEYIGKIYGYTRIDKYSHVDEHGNPCFWCTCLKCEKKFDNPVLLKSLKSGATTSCGKCATNNPEKYYQEYIGKIYEYVRIDKYSHSDKKSNPYFWCTCLKCEKKFDKPVMLGRLKSGCTTSCGNCATNNPEKYYQEYIGKVYGYTRIDKYSHSKNNISYFWCTCLRCGEKFDKPVQLASLKSGSTISCGKCAKNNPEKYYQEYIGKVYRDVRIDKYSHSNENYQPYFWCTCLRCGKKFDEPVMLQHLKSEATTSCGCRKETKGEEKIRIMLEKMEVKFEQEYTGFTDMKDKKVLRCDFWLPRFNRVIEFDGPQHFGTTGGWNNEENLKNVQRRDQIKNQYCWDHGIDIVRIPYWEIDNVNYNDLVNKYSKYLVKKD